MTIRSIASRSLPRVLPWLAGLVILGVHAAGDDAEIVALQGRGEARKHAQDDWRLAVVRERVAAGGWVRTGDFSQMALLLGDQTQLRLNRNSLLQIRKIGEGDTPTSLDLKAGRVWTQSKRRAPGTEPLSAAPAVTVQTPNATAAIRGTDWDLAVDEGGVTTLTVLSGEIEFYNEFGRIRVGASEQATVRPGEAPLKRFLSNARERVQWVTAYRPEPRRWVGDQAVALRAVIEAIEAGRTGEALSVLADRPDAASARLHADLLLFQGQVNDAIARLRPAANEALSAALLIRALLLADQAPEAAAVLLAVPAALAGDDELRLAAAELARYNGQGRVAREIFHAVTVQSPTRAEAWFGLGRVETEREFVAPARLALRKAIALAEASVGARGELAILETLANDFAVAGQLFAQALQQHPDDYVALTGQGILRLKQGEPLAALESFLKAGVIEPRYGRAALWQGVAHYQLGQAARAEEMLQRAAMLDTKDPLPHLVLSIIAADGMDHGAAIAHAQQAAERMPYLKSLNQLLNNQKGNANLGAALAQFGLEEWAQAYAYEAYSPYWAGSHLFLADRYSGSFLKNSELLKGYLTDPSVFGASNRQSSLMATPGHYATLGVRYIDAAWRQSQNTATLNGYSTAWLPFSYFLSGDEGRMWPGDVSLKASSENYNLGLGLKPNHALNFFLYANRFAFDGRTPEALLLAWYDRFTFDAHRMDGGFNLRLAPDSQLWLKTGRGREETGTRALYYAPELGQLLTNATGVEFSPIATIDHYQAQVEQRDWQVRHSLDVSPALQWSWGFEQGRQDKTLQTNVSYFSGYANLPFLSSTVHRSEEAWMAVRWQPSTAWQVDAALSHMRLTKAHDAALYVQLGTFEPVLNETSQDPQHVREFNPRFGIKWTPFEGQTVRAAAQKWRRPAALGSLAPMDSAGIPLDDRLVAVGGELKRARLQYEWQLGRKRFLEAWADYREVDNLPNPKNGNVLGDFSLIDLDRLRNRQRLLSPALDLWEATPAFGGGRVKTLAASYSEVFSEQLSGVARWQLNRGRNTSDEYAGRELPWLPGRLFNVQLNWLAMPRWQLRSTATYRSARYTDENNDVRLQGGWGFGLGSYWESADKRWSLEAALENLYARKQAAAGRSPVLGVQFLFRL